MDLDQAIKTYLEKGFGSMTKNDFEVWIFKHLLDTTLKGKDNYSISIELKIPESKVKRLKYEASLRYQSKKELHQKIDELLKQVCFKKNGQFIQFVVEDISIRKYIDALLKSKGRFSDSSFNSEIVSIDAEDLECILNSLPNGPDLLKKIKEKAQIKLKQPQVSFKEIFNKLANATLNGAGKKLGEKFIDLSINGILETISNLL